VSVSRAETLLERAAGERDRLRRHLLVAAALREVMEGEPIVVGGTAEEYHSGAAYHETDLDLCGWLREGEAELIRGLGFRKRGRHWFHAASKVAVEFPEVRIDGDEGRIERIAVGGGTAALIGVDDLYLDRLRQATAPLHDEESVEFHSALAVAAGAFDRIDRRYVLRRIRAIERSDPMVARRMREIDTRIRRRVTRALRIAEQDRGAR
jgi:hypothetical protein